MTFNIHRIQMLMDDIADRVHDLNAKHWGVGGHGAALLRLQELTQHARTGEKELNRVMHQYRHQRTRKVGMKQYAWEVLTGRTKHYKPKKLNVTGKLQLIECIEKPVRYYSQAQTLWKELKMDPRIPVEVGVATIAAFDLCEQAREQLDKGNADSSFDLYQDALEHKTVLDGVQGAQHVMQVVADNAKTAAKRRRESKKKRVGRELFNAVNTTTDKHWENRLVGELTEKGICSQATAYRWITEWKNEEKTTPNNG